MTDLDLELLLRFERGDLSDSDSRTLGARVRSDATAQEWLAWIRGLRQVAADWTPALSSDVAGPDPMDVAALAEGQLAEDEAHSVRGQLAACADGYAQLEAALIEARLSLDPAAALPSPGPAAHDRPRWVRTTIWVTTLVAAVIVAQVLRLGATGGTGGVADLALREPMPVPVLRAPELAAGLSLYRDGDYESAAQRLADQVREGPNEGRAWLYLGSARLLLGEDDAARSALLRARETCRDSFAIEATWQLAQALLAMDDAEGARSLLLELEGTRRSGNARALIDALDGGHRD